MKKLLTLLLILGMVATANATLSSSLTGDDNVGAGSVALNITPSSDQADTYMVITIQGSATLTSALGDDCPADSEIVGTMADFGLDTTYGDGDVWSMTSYTSTYPTGVWIDADYTGAVVGDVLTARESVDGSSWTTLGSITIPEPATMALLCLGGLLLRKK